MTAALYVRQFFYTELSQFCCVIFFIFVIKFS